MENFIICYDLSAPGRDYESIISAIEAYNSTRLTESCWLLHTYDDVKVIRDYLNKFIDSNDHLSVIKLGDDWATKGINKKAVNWLTQYV